MQAANENVVSILEIPEERLPSGARGYLCELAARPDGDTYAYMPIQLDVTPLTGRWNLWVEGRRWDLDDWLATFYSARE